MTRRGYNWADPKKCKHPTDARWSDGKYNWCALCNKKMGKAPKSA